MMYGLLPPSEHATSDAVDKTVRQSIIYGPDHLTCYAGIVRNLFQLELNDRVLFGY